MVDSPSPPKKSKGPGRPKLGVVSKEVTLLPRHWEWLGQQRGGASVTLRRLVDEAKRRSEGWDQLKKAEESLYRFISVMAGNQPGFEEAARALYAGDADKFKKCSENWARDVREHALSMAEKVFYRGA